VFGVLKEAELSGSEHSKALPWAKLNCPFLALPKRLRVGDAGREIQVNFEKNFQFVSMPKSLMTFWTASSFQVL